MMMKSPEAVLVDPFPFFRKAHQNFIASTERSGKIKQFYRLAGFTFCLQFAGNVMAEALTPALKHLRVEEQDTSDLTICIWDSSHTSPVEFPWPNNVYDLRGEVIGYNNDQIYTVVDIHTKALNVFDKESKLALFWVKDAAQLPWWIGGSPLQLILHWWMREQGHQLTHAAAIGYPEGGVLLAGKSGSGKSTTALACMKAGMKYVGEDYCLISDLPKIWVHSVYNSAKIGEQTLRWFPELERHVTNSQRSKGDKAFLFHQMFQPEKILFGCPLKALIALKIGESRESFLKPIPPNEAIAALSVSTMWQLTHTGPRVFNHFKRVAESLPCYALHLSSDLMEAPRMIAKIL